ncbi:hypothetical protein H6F78_18135 [Coleofasciculus sp. FACHB-64]|uniref:hypothetical protein n=1 Tax=Cyanophyceae TaxID=3028117 RepID=UPI0016836C84|nr:MULTISPECIES: hypothetical protein [unclassified Coleofasciculus]MBD1838855.1 hypothetical protein [Coleofasciculus sp. FACHB-501]MBD1890445.1 hypothetical protein [Coleofasciculus sp. FACHB-SPT9]MBD1894182.1 hypothetical protein [Coleofasciculus sp. FACHB-129]MBD1902511.1 hypothetical protein [Coleofasciculus sp. FACHB-125]MBD1941128.1 hypothetical protein [Coleofasciculus sp. FACHB-712]
MDLPLYCIVGDRPVKAIETEDGGMDVLAYEWDTGEFKRAMQYLSKITLGDGEIDYVSEQEFEQYVEKLRQQAS